MTNKPNSIKEIIAMMDNIESPRTNFTKQRFDIHVNCNPTEYIVPISNPSLLQRVDIALSRSATGSFDICQNSKPSCELFILHEYVMTYSLDVVISDSWLKFVIKLDTYPIDMQLILTMQEMKKIPDPETSWPVII